MDSWWKHTATALAGVLLTLATLWVNGTFASVSRNEVREIVDRRFHDTLRLVESNADTIKTLAEDNKKLNIKLAELIGKLNK